jgi:hypothetical protein
MPAATAVNQRGVHLLVDVDGCGAVATRRSVLQRNTLQHVAARCTASIRVASRTGSYADNGKHGIFVEEPAALQIAYLGTYAPARPNTLRARAARVRVSASVRACVCACVLGCVGFLSVRAHICARAGAHVRARRRSGRAFALLRSSASHGAPYLQYIGIDRCRARTHASALARTMPRARTRLLSR